MNAKKALNSIKFIRYGGMKRNLLITFLFFALTCFGQEERLKTAKHYIENKCKKYAIKIHKFLKCKGVTRTDLRFDEKKSLGKKLFVLEINTQPGMTPLSLVPMMAKYKGLSFNELIKEIINEI